MAVETKREQEHDPKSECGVEVEPCRQVAANAGWLVEEKSASESGYTGENAPWRR